jgi:hypothetical protein
MADLLDELGYVASVVGMDTNLRDAPWYVHIVAKPDPVKMERVVKR